MPDSAVINGFNEEATVDGMEGWRDREMMEWGMAGWGYRGVTGLGDCGMAEWWVHVMVG